MVWQIGLTLCLFFCPGFYYGLVAGNCGYRNCNWQATLCVFCFVSMLITWVVWAILAVWGLNSYQVI